MKDRELNAAENKEDTVRAPYETPAIIYEGLITTRSGCRVVPGGGESPDPADIFGGGD